MNRRLDFLVQFATGCLVLALFVLWVRWARSDSLLLSGGKLVLAGGKGVVIATTTTTTIPDTNMVPDGAWLNQPLEIYKPIGSKGNGIITNGATYRVIFDWEFPASAYDYYGMQVTFGATVVGDIQGGGQSGVIGGTYTNTAVWDTAANYFPYQYTNLCFYLDTWGIGRKATVTNIYLYYVSGP